MPKLDRRQVLGALATGALPEALIASAAQSTRTAAVKPAAPDTRPNTLVILLEDLRWDALGCTGHPFVKTPNIDRIAREGARFDNAFTTTPLGSPARATFLTGQWAHQHEIRNNGENGPTSMRLKSFPLLQQQAGYETAFIGKWHMGSDDAPRPGFDRWVSLKGQGQYVNPVFNLDGRAAPQAGYLTDLLNGQAVEFIRRRRGKPFSLVLSHKAAQGPFIAPERHRTLFASDPIRHAPSSSDTLEGKPALRRILAGNPLPLRPPTDEAIRQQLQCLTSVDEGLGRIFATLDEIRQTDNTFIVFASNNGCFWGEHGLSDKRAAYEESIRIPLLMRYPKLIRPGTRLRNYVLNTDLASTMVEISRSNPVPEIKGRSLVPLLEGRVREWRRSFLCEYFEEPAFPRIPSWQAIRTERWKYIRYTNIDGMDEIYDLASDPGEVRNLISDPATQSALDDCREDMGRLWRETF